MIRRPPRSTQSRSSAASDVYKRQLVDQVLAREVRQGVDGQAFARPAQDGLDAGEQLRVVERLCQVVVGATLEALHDVMRFVERREHDDWDVPVSYTHLRAHETRHDLVCRLLLEKKKKTN